MPDNAQSWRDIKDQLTEDQYAHLAALEDAGGQPDALLLEARELAAENEAEDVAEEVWFAQVEPPPEAKLVFGWQSDADEGWFREFSCLTTRVGGVAMHVAGRQFSDDRCERRIDLWADDPSKLTAAQGRELAAALIEAADMIDAPAGEKDTG
ncbi:hypothetical protein [Mycobacterium sp.]|uniref:hypothetical protein n=1 Tax=Mycobacterium sp. TaxID=1785 RepID=UPI002C546FD2|nr:hypothetical protein [Mycobacterium sp.]HME49685.1 hypothetical protein [Mycobacterium sp.]